MRAFYQEITLHFWFLRLLLLHNVFGALRPVTPFRSGDNTSARSLAGDDLLPWGMGDCSDAPHIGPLCVMGLYGDRESMAHGSHQ